MLILMKQVRLQWNFLTVIIKTTMYLYGASGHGSVIKEILEANNIMVDAFIDDNLSIDEKSGLPVLHSADNADEVIVSIGDNEIRKMIVDKLNCRFGIAVHPSAIVSPYARIGEGTVVMPGSVINAGAKIGKHCIINTGACVDHECVIDDFAHISPNVALCGQVHVGEGTLVGVGSSIIPCVHIGDWSIIGAGAVILKDVPSEVTVVGVPGRVIKINSKE